MSKVLDLVWRNRKELNRVWMSDLEEINLHRQLGFIYEVKDLSTERANLMLAFIVLSYDPKSGWLDMHKNRMDNKRKIMRNLGGDPEDKFCGSVINGSNLTSQELKVRFMKYLKNWKWDSIMSFFDYHAEMNEFAGYRTMEEVEEVGLEDGDDDSGPQEVRRVKALPTKDIAKTNLDKGENLKKGLEARLKGEELWEDIKKEFMPTDTALEREGRMRITEAIDIESWEHFIRSLKREDR